MIINIIVGVVIIGCIAAVVVMIVKKSKQLSQIDTSTIPEEKHAEVKSSLMEQRLERKFKTVGSYLGNKTKPVFVKMADSAHKLKDKVISLEKHYKERAKAKQVPTLEKQEETRQKINKLFTEADELYKAESWPEAEKKYLEIIGLDLKNNEAYEKLGWIYYQLKDYVHAKETLEFVKKLNPKDDQIYFGLGEICMALDKKEEALLNFKEAVKLSPNDPKNLDKLIESAIEMKDKFLANSTFDKLKQVNPENQKLTEFSERLEELGK